MSVINKYILFVIYFIEKRALSLCISFIDLSTRRNIEQTPGQLRRHCRLVPLRRCCYPERRQRWWWRHLQRLKRSDYDRGIDGGDINDDLDGDGEERPNINETGEAGARFYRCRRWSWAHAGDGRKLQISLFLTALHWRCTAFLVRLASSERIVIGEDAGGGLGGIDRVLAPMKVSGGHQAGRSKAANGCQQL